MSMSIVWLMLLLALANSQPPPDPPDVPMEETEADEEGMEVSNAIPKVVLNEVFQVRN